MGIEILGWIATIFSCLFLLPQVLKVIKYKKTNELSIWFTIIGTFNGVLWSVYGGLTNTIPVMITNIIMCIFSLIMLTYKIYNIKKGQDDFQWPWNKEIENAKNK